MDAEGKLKNQMKKHCSSFGFKLSPPPPLFFSSSGTLVNVAALLEKKVMYTGIHKFVINFADSKDV